MKKLKLLLCVCALLLGVNGAWATDWVSGSAPADNGNYYLYNVGAKGYLTAGNYWGTQAIIDREVGMKCTFKLNNGAYQISTLCSNGGNTSFGGTYMDSGKKDIYFRETSSGSGIYQLSINNDFTSFIGYSGDLTVADNLTDATADNTKWILLTPSDIYSAMQKQGSTVNPMPVSMFVQGADLNRNDTGVNQWIEEHTGGNFTKQGGGSQNNTNGNLACEYWNNKFDFYQTISGLPAGKYRFRCSGYGTNSTTKIYIKQGNNESSANFANISGSKDFTNAAADIASGQYTGNEVIATLTGDDFIIGIKRETNSKEDWTVIDRFRLDYMGNDCSSSIQNPTFDANADGWEGKGAWGEKEVEFYNTTFDMYQNLSGLSAGIYALEAQGFYRNGAGIDEKRAKASESLLASLYAKGEDNVERSTNLLSIYEEAGKVGSNSSLFGDIPNWMNQAQSFISAGYYADNKVLVEVGDAGTLRIGAKKTVAVGADWTILDNFSLTKLNFETLTDAYSAEWTARKAAANELLSSYTNIVAGSEQRTALTSALAASPSTVNEYATALTTLRLAVNNFKAAKYAYDLYATNKEKATEAYNAETTTYVNVTGTEKTTFNNAYADYVSGFSPATSNAETYYTTAKALGSAIDAFTDETMVNKYNEYVAEVATADLLGTDISGVSTPTTAAEALSAAHSINVLNYNRVVEEEYEDVSGTTLGEWTDNNVASRRGQHWDGTTNEETGTEYFEMNAGYNNTSWNMSRSQDVNLAAGKYILKVACRVSSKANATLSVTVGGNTISTISGHQGDSGKGITTGGVASYDTGTFANENNGRGFEWKYIPFELNETGTATLSFTAEGHAVYQYVSFTSLSLLTDPKVAARTALLNKINEATATRKSANEGTGVFQIPDAEGTTFGSAITTAQNVYNNDDATLDIITNATTTLNTAIETYENATLIAPSSSQHYRLKIATTGHAKNGNAVVISLGDTGDKNPTGYGFNASAAPASYLAQSLTFTQVSENNYNICFETAQGPVYLTYGTNNGSKADWKDSQIQGTTDASKKGSFKIAATSTANVFNIYNTLTNSTIACQTGANAGNIYTEDGNADFTIAEASQASVDVTIASTVKYATRIFPFTPSLPTGVKAYSCEAKGDGDVLTLVEVDEPAANTPYILYAENGVSSTDLTGWGTAAATSYTAGWLTGVYTATPAPVNSYVLQNNGGTVGFYKVEGTDSQPTIGANRCYLTVPAADPGAGSKAFFFDSEALGISAISALTSGEAEIYNMNGVRLPNLQKGMNIIKMKNGKTQKVMVK